MSCSQSLKAPALVFQYGSWRMTRNCTGDMCLDPRQEDYNISKKYMEGPYKLQLGGRPTSSIYDTGTLRLWSVYQSSQFDKTKKGFSCPGGCLANLSTI